jgi:transcription antitermination protein NusB
MDRSVSRSGTSRGDDVERTRHNPSTLASGPQLPNMLAVAELNRDIRKLALQVLFALDAQPDAPREPLMATLREETTDESALYKAVALAEKAWAGRTIADAWSTRLAPQWPVHRQPAVDRAVIRLGIYELTNTDTPPKVVIDEAIELAKSFSTANSQAFVNGILDAVLKEVAALKKPG